MDQVDEIRDAVAAAPQAAAKTLVAVQETPPKLMKGPPLWQAGLALGAAALGLGAAALFRKGPVPQRPRAPAAFAPAGKTLAGASPAVLAQSPRRHLYAGPNPAAAVTVEDLRAMAHRRLPDFALDYFEGGGEDEATLARNSEALAEWRFKHRSFVDVSKRDTSTVLFDRKMAMPVAVAPTGLNGVLWPNADLHLAEAAAASGVPFAQSTMSNDGMSRVAQVPGLRYWWQLYVFGPTEVRNTLIDRARDHGCEALILTCDAQIYGNREWDKRNRLSSNQLSLTADLDAMMHPRWLVSRLAHGLPRFENVLEFVPKGHRGLFTSAHWIRQQMDKALDWDIVKEIRDRWPRKLILKGLLDVADVVRAQQIGADAVALSNHGGRQLDWAVSALDILPAARAAVGDRMVLIADGGVRRGTDVLKFLALGADAVFAGRAILYGVAAAGRAGAKRALDILHEEIDRDLGLMGVPSIGGLDRSLLVRTRGADGPAA
ncbi:MAG TPA: alpha-hydroxy acid oxidase [Stellaceae bacterium]|nr:alpha-hydroxy acid oxidase [Stellaceae bacterium]